jgi:hypothetical protein
VLANLRTQIFGKPMLSAGEYEGTSAGSFVQFAVWRRLRGLSEFSVFTIIAAQKSSLAIVNI